MLHFEFSAWTHFPSVHLLRMRVHDLFLIPPHKEILKVCQYGERTRGYAHFFPQHRDPILTQVAKELPSFRDMPNLLRIKSHQACAGRIGRDRIIGEHDLPELVGASLQWSVAFHSC